MKRQASALQFCRHLWEGIFGAARVGLAKGGEERYLFAVPLLQQLNLCLELGEGLVPDLQVWQGKPPVDGSHLLQADSATPALFQQKCLSICRVSGVDVVEETDHIDHIFI